MSKINKLIPHYDRGRRRWRVEFTDRAPEEGDLLYVASEYAWSGLYFPSVLDIQLRADGHSSVSTILYVTEDLSDSLEEQLRKMNDPDALVFDSICDEIFGDG